MNSSKTKSLVTYLPMLFIIGWFLNFVLFVALSMYLGGDALNGKIQDGHHFLGSHGKYTEVSYEVFTYSKIHTVIFIGWHLLVFIYAGIASFRERRKPH